MFDFIKWFNETNDLDSLVKASIAHLWFVTIHPFDDGNGRIARAIGDMQLSKSDGVNQRFYSMSSQINAEKKSYYQILEQTQKEI
jgi:Fic family protein